MDKLLQWSIAQQSGDKEAIEKIGAPDEKLLLQLFGAPDEPALMKQAITVISNPEAKLEDKEVAFDNFEMLIENLDNANNIENIKLWPPIIAQLLVPETSLRTYAASVIATAVQNNPSSQEAFIKYDGLEKLITICKEPTTPSSLLVKSLFAISCVIRNFDAGYELFATNGGWEVFNIDTRSVDDKVKLRILSLISAIFSTGLDATKKAAMVKIELVRFLALVLGDHAGCVDKVCHLVCQMKDLGWEFTSDEEAELKTGLERVSGLKDRLDEAEYERALRVLG